MGSAAKVTVGKRAPMGAAAIVCTLSLLLIPGSADAAKAKKGKPGNIVSRSTSVPVPPHQLGTAVATCPAGTKAVGGGFDGSPGGLEPTIVTESRRAGKRAWTVSAIRGSVLTTTTGQVTAMVRCRSGVPKMKQAVASTSIPAATGPGDRPRGSATATCPGNRRAVAGGFSTVVEPTTAVVVLAQQSQLTGGGRAWIFSASHNNTLPRTITSYAYCARSKLKKAVSDTVSLTGDLTTKPADTPACASGLAPLSGGFVTSKASLAGGGDVVFVLNSLPQGGGWRTTAMHSGGTTTGSIRTFAYCG